jgi:predicted transcriptional regulator
MKLVDPTDFEILKTLQGGRNVATNVAAELDQDRAYMNTRMPQLHDHGLVDKIGPAANSGLYELTDRGRTAIACQEQYGYVDPNRFEAIVDETR